MWLSWHSDGFLDHLSCRGEKIQTCAWNLEPSLKTKPPDCFFLRGCRRRRRRRRHLPVCQPPSAHQPVAAECRWVSERDGAPLITGRRVINGGGVGGREEGGPIWRCHRFCWSVFEFIHSSREALKVWIMWYSLAVFFSSPFCFWTNERIYFGRE